MFASALQIETAPQKSGDDAMIKVEFLRLDDILFSIGRYFIYDWTIEYVRNALVYQFADDRVLLETIFWCVLCARRQALWQRAKVKRVLTGANLYRYL